MPVVGSRRTGRAGGPGQPQHFHGAPDHRRPVVGRGPLRAGGQSHWPCSTGRARASPSPPTWCPTTRPSPTARCSSPAGSRGRAIPAGIPVATVVRRDRGDRVPGVGDPPADGRPDPPPVCVGRAVGAVLVTGTAAPSHPAARGHDDRPDAARVVLGGPALRHRPGDPDARPPAWEGSTPTSWSSSPSWPASSAGPARGATMGFGAGLVADLFLPTPSGCRRWSGACVGFGVGVDDPGPRPVGPVAGTGGRPGGQRGATRVSTPCSGRSSANPRCSMSTCSGSSWWCR